MRWRWGWDWRWRRHYRDHEIARQKAAAERATREKGEQVREKKRQAKEHALALKNLRDILDVALSGDLNTPAGLTRLSLKLTDEAAKLEKQRRAIPTSS